MVEVSGMALLTATMPVVLMVAIGYLFRKKKWVGQETQYGLMRLVVWVFTPCLIIDRVLGNRLLQDFAVVGKVLLAGFLTIALGILVAYLASRFFGVSEAERRRVFGYCAGIYNYGYMALPVCISLCSPETVGMMLLFNTGVEVGIWTVGLAVVSGNLEPKKLAGAFVNPIFISMLIALALNFLGWDGKVPTWFCAATESLGACMIPGGVMLVGMSLPVLLSGFRMRDELSVSVGAIAVRLGLIPALMVASAVFLPGLPQDLRYILVIQSAMPAAMLPIVIVQYYKGDAKLALRVVLVSTIACVVSLPFWVKIGFWLLAHNA